MRSKSGTPLSCKSNGPKPHGGAIFVAKAVKPWLRQEVQTDFGGIVAFFLQQY
tara:strand:+ start:270 stop:428 length:159 start_codon:yes stop_codon:yes gene_type:complete